MSAEEIIADLNDTWRKIMDENTAPADTLLTANPGVNAAFEYHTTSQLQGMVALKTGKPCNSRNRPALLKKLGMQETGKTGAVVDAGGPGDYDKVSRLLKDVAKGGKKVAALAKKIAKSKGEKPRTGKAKGVKLAVGGSLHALALRAVTSAMARKSPPSLRVLCAELEERGVKTPRGLKKWMPSSVQSLMRQAKAGK